MDSLKISDPIALQILMDENLYLIRSEAIPEISATQSTEKPVEVQPAPVAEAEKPTEIPAQEPSFFEYLGENNKYLLILVDEPGQKSLAPNHLETLTNILKGKKQELKDVAVVNLHHYPQASFTGLKTFFACSSMVLFGINPSKLKIEGTAANQISVYQGTKVLATFSISEMLNNVDKKRAFWDEMKKL